MSSSRLLATPTYSYPEQYKQNGKMELVRRQTPCKLSASNLATWLI